MAFQSPEVLRGGSQVAVAFDAEAFQELDGGLRCLGEAVFGAKVDTEDRHGCVMFCEYFSFEFGFVVLLKERSVVWKSRAI